MVGSGIVDANAEGLCRGIDDRVDGGHQSSDGGDPWDWLQNTRPWVEDNPKIRIQPF